MSWRAWLPTPQQMSDAAQLRPNPFGAITMRQGMGMILFLGLVAGIIPFFGDWILGLRAGSAVPLARLGEMGAWLELRLGSEPFPVPLLGDLRPWATLFQTLPQMETGLPGWLGATLSALGLWVQRPLDWMGLWIVYGALVMVLNKALGATNTLQRFYAATAFAFVPLLFTGLAPIPCVGQPLSWLARLWAVAVYLQANRQVTGFSWSRAAVAVLLPGAVAGALMGSLLLGLLLLGLFL